jgi:hypothetical protein
LKRFVSRTQIYIAQKHSSSLIMAPMRIVNISFVTKPQRANPRLTFPAKVADALGLLSTRKKLVFLVIRRPTGDIIYADRVPLRSGTEIYGATDIKPALQKLKSGEEIWIEAWKPN